jgi:hypothetical protein
MPSNRPINELPVSAIPAASGISGPAPFYYSDRGYTTGPTDPDLPNRHFAPRLSNGLTLERSLPLSPLAGSRSLLQVGSLGFVNADGGMDGYLRDYALDGRAIEVKFGRPDFAYGAFSTLFKGTARAALADSRAGLRFELRDASWRLERPAQTSFYAGTGGLEGGSEISGLPRPIAYGACRNVTPVLVDAGLLLFQVADRPIRGITAVHDRGLALTHAGDVADILTASPPAGTYVTQLSGGYFRLGALPDGTVTADVEGDASYGTYVTKTADIAFRLMCDRAGFTDAGIDATAFDRLRSDQPAPIGLYVGTETVSVADLLDLLFGGIGGWWGVNAEDVIDCGRIGAPADRAVAAGAVAYFSGRDVLAFGFIDLPAAVNPPWYRIRVGYARNWTVQESDLAGAVGATRRQFLAHGYRYALWSDPLVSTTHLRAQEPPAIPTLFADEADANFEAARLGVLWGRRRSGVRFTTKLKGFLQRPGETIHLDLPVAPLAGGRNVVIVGQGFDTGTNTVTLDVMW